MVNFLKGIKSPFASKLLIKTMKIEGVASFTDATHAALKKYNFFYGLNGSGKTTISKLLADQAHDLFNSSELRFSSPDNPPETLVYNEDYIAKNFHSENLQKGIFTLDESNTTAVEEIKAARARKTALEAQKAPIDNRLAALRSEESMAEEAFIEDLYKYPQKYKQTPLKACLKGAMSPKGKFKDKLLTIQSSDLNLENISSELEKLEQEYAELENADATEKPIFPLIKENTASHEVDPLLSQKIIGSSDSYLSDIIETLDHENWVTTGITEYLAKTNDCPFCKRLMDQELKQNIKAHINEAYIEKVANLSNALNEYSEIVDRALETIKDYENDANLMTNPTLKVQCSSLSSTLENNIRSFTHKHLNPSQVVQLKDSVEIIKGINSIIESVNGENTIYNDKLKNSGKAKSQINEKFWSYMRKLADETINTYNKKIKRVIDERTTEQGELRPLHKKIQKEDNTISEQQKLTKNVDEAVNWINSHLNRLGLSGFFIEKETDEEIPFYRLKRTDTKEGVFHTLSEGEKTLISFLYFVQSCTGVSDPDTQIDYDKRVIVIDDPISSLSFNHVFDVACMIEKVFFRENVFGQVLILTHHLYFFHELLRQIAPRKEKKFEVDYALFRVIKGDASEITTVKRGDIQNNYQSYWQIVKDVKDNKASSVILPNAMRNILDHYFSFIHKEESLSQAFKKLKDKSDDISFATFERYVNKESHSDDVTLTDVKEVDTAKFIGYFEDVFKETAFHDHYLIMMGIEEDEPPLNRSVAVTGPPSITDNIIHPEPMQPDN